MDEYEEHVDELQNKIDSIRADIRAFYRKYPKYDPQFRGMSEEKIQEAKMTPEERLSRFVKETINGHASRKRNDNA